MSNSIVELVNDLPQGGITVKVLKALDFVAPGTWYPATDFDDLVEQVTGVRDRATRKRIRQRAIDLYDAPNAPYEFCVKLYKTIDKTDAAIGAAAIANQVGDKVKLLSLLNKLTPKPDTLQSIDLVMKLAVELVVFCKLNRIEPNPRTFAKAVAENYSGPAMMRMATLVCVDGILPLGPQFINKVEDILDGSEAEAVSNSKAFKAVSGFLPGGNPMDKVSFLKDSFVAMEGWMQGLVSRTGVNPSRILGKVGRFIDGADGKMDFVAALLDQTMNYYEYTGIQTVATHLIEDAYDEVQKDPAPAPQRQSAPAAAPQRANNDIPPERMGPDGEFNQSGLAQRVQLAFQSDPNLKAVSSLYVAQAGTKVVLKGSIPSQHLHNRAVQLAEAQNGCQTVDSSQLIVG